MGTDNEVVIKRTRLVRIVDALCAMMLIVITIGVVCSYGMLPDRIPVHYNINGVIDGYGNKAMIWLVLFFTWFPVVVLSVVEQFPRCWNTPFKLNDENRCRVLTLTWHLLSTTKFIIAGIFTYLTAMILLGRNLSVFFAPAFLTLIISNSLYWLVRMFLNRRTHT